MSAALKLNLFREKDPIMDKELLTDLQREVDWNEFEIHEDIERVRLRLDFAETKEEKRGTSR